MGWSLGYDTNWQRDIGYGVPATCDHPGCGAKIDRGLSYVCGGEPYGGDAGCGLYFCDEHLPGRDKNFRQLCERCAKKRKPFKPTPDVKEWAHHKAAHPSWARWRSEQPNFKAGDEMKNIALIKAHIKTLVELIAAANLLTRAAEANKVLTPRTGMRGGKATTLTARHNIAAEHYQKVEERAENEVNAIWWE
jgi:hypothetical protein